MTTTVADLREALDRRIPMGTVRDTFAITQRNLIGYRRVPQLLVFSTIQPVIFVLMFRYVFGGSVRLFAFPFPYVDYLMPGIFAQTVVFGAIATAIGLATDVKSGLMERFHALPMARSAVLVGRTTADLVRNVFVVILMMLVGVLVGWRIHTNVVELIFGALLLMLFAFALSWIFATIGLAVKDPEAAQAAAFPILAPLVFASDSFVQVHFMPGWLQPFSRNQPVSVTVDAVRALVNGPQALVNGGTTLHYVFLSLCWSVAIIAVFATLSVRLYRKAV